MFGFQMQLQGRQGEYHLSCVRVFLQLARRSGRAPSARGIATTVGCIVHSISLDTRESVYRYKKWEIKKIIDIQYNFTMTAK